MKERIREKISIALGNFTDILAELKAIHLHGES